MRRFSVVILLGIWMVWIGVATEPVDPTDVLLMAVIASLWAIHDRMGKR